MDKWQVGGWGRGGVRGGCCSWLKSTVKIFDIYTEDSEYIQAATGEEDHLFPCTRYVWHSEYTTHPHARSVTVLCSFLSLLSPVSRAQSWHRYVSITPLFFLFIHVIFGEGGWGECCSAWPADLSSDCLSIWRETGRSSPPRVPLSLPQSAGVFGSEGTCVHHSTETLLYLFLKFLNNLLWLENSDGGQATCFIRVLSPRVDPFPCFLFSSPLGKAEGDCEWV